MVVLDPGPDDPEHLRALARAVEGAREVRIAVTHGHADHAGGAPALATMLGAPLFGPAGAADSVVPLPDGGTLETDHGALVAVETPGHAPEHLAFHWPDASAVFVGDLLLGEGDTTWVGEYPGCVADYLRSLDRLEALGPEVLYPTHGPPIEDPPAALGRYRGHRTERIHEVREVLADDPSADAAEVVRRVYGGRVPPGLEGAARRSAEVLLHHVRSEG